MSGSAELLILRLGLVAILLAFVLAAALVMRQGLMTRVPSRVTGAQRSAAGARARLVVVSPAFSGLPVGAEFALAGQTSLGRDPESGIVVVDASVSGRHAELDRRGQQWVVRDLGSTNGTFVEGRRADGRGLTVPHGATLAFGAVTMRFELG
jgi:FHA domain